VQFSPLSPLGSFSFNMTPDKTVYAPGDRITYQFGGIFPPQHYPPHYPGSIAISCATFTLDSNIQYVTDNTPLFNVVCRITGNSVICKPTGMFGTGWWFDSGWVPNGNENPLQISGIISPETPPGTLITSSGTFRYFSPPPPCGQVVFETAPVTSTVTVGPGGPILVLTPPEEIARVYESNKLTALVLDDSEKPVVGTLVTFRIISGPDAGKDGTSRSDASGQATFTYTNNAVGTDSVVASYIDPAGSTISSGFSTIMWVSEIPEFPSPVLPTVMIIGFLGVMFYLRQTRQH
ncbi:MAG: Ig-like domain-containing protein, partial [Methanoregula sp.]